MSQDKRPPMPTNFTWFSICSAHRKYNPECNCCNAGSWVNDEKHELSGWLYKHDPKLWRKWANRETTPDQPGHAARHFLESIFPGLKKSGQ